MGSFGVSERLLDDHRRPSWREPKSHPAPGSWPLGPEPPPDDSVEVPWEVLERAPRPSEVEVNVSIAAGPPPEPEDEVDPDEAKEANERAIDLLLAAFPGAVVEEVAA